MVSLLQISIVPTRRKVTIFDILFLLRILHVKLNLLHTVSQGIRGSLQNLYMIILSRNYNKIGITD